MANVFFFFWEASRGSSALVILFGDLPERRCMASLQQSVEMHIIFMALPCLNWPSLHRKHFFKMKRKPTEGCRGGAFGACICPYLLGHPLGLAVVALCLFFTVYLLTK